MTKISLDESIIIKLLRARKNRVFLQEQCLVFNFEFLGEKTMKNCFDITRDCVTRLKNRTRNQL